MYAIALLLLEAGEYGPKWIFAKVGGALRVIPRSLEHLKKRFVEEGLPVAIEQKNQLKPHVIKYWKIPPDQNASFVVAMEDVLHVCAQP